MEKWKDKRSIFNVSRKQDGEVDKIKGQYWVHDVQFNFGFSRTTHGEYLMRGHCSLISPRDGHVLQVQGEERREQQKKLHEKGIDVSGGRREEFNATAAMYSRSADLDQIKEIIENTAEKLYGKNILAIEDHIKHAAPDQNMHATLAARLYCTKFFQKSTASERTVKSNKNVLIRICTAIDNYPMGAIPEKAILELAKKLGRSAKTKLRLAQQFFEFCRAKGIYDGKNPFNDFFNHNDLGNTKDIKALQTNTITLRVLPPEVEQKLNDLIYTNIMDGRMIGLAVVKGSGLSSKEVCSLKFNDFIFSEEDYRKVFIKIRRDDIAGATHDYTRPIFPFEGFILHRRHDLLCDKYSPEKVRLFNVATALGNDKKSLSSKDLTAFCRTTLLHCGMSHAALSVKDVEPGGVGLRLLQQNYEHKITIECGLQDDIATARFLQARSLNGDVTANNYWSFSDEDGGDRLFCIVSRDRRFEPCKNEADCIKREILPDGRERITVESPDPQRLAAGSIRLRLPPGAHFSVSSPCGVQGCVTVKEVDDGFTQISLPM